MAWATHPADTVTTGLWPDAAHLPDSLVSLLLEAAGEAVAAFAPTLAAGAPVPARYTIATVMHARDIHNASRRAPDGTYGAEEFAVQVRPLSLDVRQLLRPRRPRPRFGAPAEETP